MKYGARAKRLARKQKAYDKLIAENPNYERQFTRPGSLRKS